MPQPQMSPPSFSLSTALCALAAVFAAACQHVSDDDTAGDDGKMLPQSPNVVIIFTDDQGYGDVGVNGAEGFETPHLDQLAAEGLQLTDFYVAPVCTPSRAQLLTGRYAHRLGLGHRVLFPFSKGGIAAAEWTMAEALRAAGYRTGMVGKWHLGHTPEYHPTRHGFDDFFGVPYSNDMNRHHYKHNDFQSPPLPVYRGTEVIEEDPDQALLTRRYTEEAQKFLRQHHERPFFLYMAHTMPHLPIFASPEFSGKTEIGLYGDVIAEIDWSVGQIMNTLEELGVADNTIVIFTSDNGPWRQKSSGGLRGKKASTWEGGMRVPCFVRWPAAIEAGGKCREPITSMDLLPTLANWAHAPLSAAELDGDDVGAVLLGGELVADPTRAVYYYRNNVLEAIRQGEWKLHISRAEWKKLDPKPNEWLFNLRQDPNEATECASSYPEVVKSLRDLIQHAPLPSPAK